MLRPPGMRELSKVYAVPNIIVIVGILATNSAIIVQFIFYLYFLFLSSTASGPQTCRGLKSQVYCKSIGFDHFINLKFVRKYVTLNYSINYGGSCNIRQFCGPVL